MDTISEPLKTFCDNDTVRRFAHNDKVSSKSKFLKVKYLVLKEKVRDRLMSIVWIPTSLVIAYHLTKALAPNDYKEHVRNMGQIELPC